MTNATGELKKASKLISESKSILIVLSSKPSDDALAAALSLYLSLTKLTKPTTIISSGEIKLDLIGVEKIKNELTVAGDNLVITIPYNEDAIDKIDYSIQGDKLNIVVTPSSPDKKIEPDKVELTQSGGNVDLIITVDVDSLKRLDYIYKENEAFFKETNVLNIDRHIANSYFGKVNLIERSSSSTSEVVLNLLKELKAKVDKDIATNLYFGIRAATNNFSSFSVTPETLETSAYLLRQGAAKKSGSFVPKPSIFNQKTSGIRSVEKEKTTKETEDDEELRPKIFRPGNTGA